MTFATACWTLEPERRGTGGVGRAVVAAFPAFGSPCAAAGAAAFPGPAGTLTAGF